VPRGKGLPDSSERNDDNKRHARYINVRSSGTPRSGSGKLIHFRTFALFIKTLHTVKHRLKLWQ
jgi:hypothetical protein